MQQSNQIPKIIHYCWFGKKPKSKLINKCIKSWKKFLPDYEIKEWNEDNFDINSCPYVQEAYAAKKYAFVTDYVRFWALYQYGGIYFDTDVELIKPIDIIVANGPFMAREFDYPKYDVAPGLGIGAVPKMDICAHIVEYYNNVHFRGVDGKINMSPVVVLVTDILKHYGLTPDNTIQKVNGMLIYPKEYFCPIDYRTGKRKITKKTVAIHHYMASWVPPILHEHEWHLKGTTYLKLYRIKKSRFMDAIKFLKEFIFLILPMDRTWVWAMSIGKPYVPANRKKHNIE